MTLSELTAYAEEKFQIREQYKWTDFPGFSVLCHPDTGKWIALLMRQWDSDLGEEVERCDIKCGQEFLEKLHVSCLSKPFRMHSPKWVGVKFEPATDKELVLRLFDRAFYTEEQNGGVTLVLGPRMPTGQTGYQDTPIAVGQSIKAPEIPEAIRQMLLLYDYGDGSNEQRCRNFYRQGKLMERYEDDAPWDGDFKRYFTTYHDLNIRQLRGYFTWRTKWRRGEHHGIAVSMAYLYLYELLNGIGTASPEDGLQKMLDFERNYIDAGLGDETMRRNLRRWMFEFAVLNTLPAETTLRCADPEMIQRDHALTVLRDPAERTDGEVVDALCLLAGKKTAFSLPGQGLHLVAETWRYALQKYHENSQDLFTTCFGEQRQFAWYPLFNTVYYREQTAADTDYRLNECRIYLCREGKWHERHYEKLYFNLDRLREFLHQTDLRLRRYLKTGHYLRENPQEAWALPYVEAVIADDRRQQEEAARSKVDIHLERLENIREDALKTRDSLLTEEEMEEEGKSEAAAPSEVPETASSTGLPVETRILLMLLQGDPPDELIKARHLMPSVVADAINEAYFDEIGDNIVECEADRLTLVKDYTEEIKQILNKAL